METEEELEQLQISYKEALHLASQVLNADFSDNPRQIAVRLLEIAYAIREEDMQRRHYIYTGESDF